MSSPIDLLVVMPSWVGDIVMATPAIAALRAAHPTWNIVASVKPGGEALLSGAPFCDECVVSPMRGVLGPLRDGARLRQRGVERVLLLPNSFRSAIFARACGARERVGSAREGRSVLLTNAIALHSSDTPSTTLDDYCEVAERGFQVTVADRTVRLATTPHDDDAADELLQGVDGPFIALNPGGNKPEKRWPAQRFAQLAEALTASTGCAIVLNGAPSERALLASIVDACAIPLVDLAQRGVTLGALKAVMQRAQLLVTNDTGPRHIAAAFGTPSVVFFGPTDRRWTVLPGVRERHLVAEPFLLEECIADDHPEACTVDRIALGDALFAADALLSENQTP